MDQWGFCDKPDRDQPKIICGYPMPCPYHTIIVDVESETVTIPAHDHNARIKTKARGKLKAIVKALK